MLMLCLNGAVDRGRSHLAYGPSLLGARPGMLRVLPSGV